MALQDLLSIFEYAMLTFHLYVWGRWALKFGFPRLFERKVKPRKEIVTQDGIYAQDPKTLKWEAQQLGRPLISTGLGMAQPSGQGLAGLFKEVYGDKIADIFHEQDKDAYRIVNKDGTQDEISHQDLVAMKSDMIIRGEHNKLFRRKQ